LTTKISDVSTAPPEKHLQKNKKTPETKDLENSQKSNSVLPEDLRLLISTLLAENPDSLPPNLSQEDVLEFTDDLLRSNTKKSFSNLNSYAQSPEKFLSFLSTLQDMTNQRKMKIIITRLLNLVHDLKPSADSESDSHQED